MTRLAALLRQERGYALATSLIVLGIIVSLSLPLLTLVDTQQNQSAHERKSESSFNLAEAAFDAGAFVLSHDWPASVQRAYPTSCTAASAGTKCPDPQLLERTYTGSDYSARGWTIQIRDDVDGGNYYDPVAVDAQPSWDANGNAKLWVRADARGVGLDRTVLALVRRQDQLEPFPRNAATAGWFGTPNGGLKVLVDTQGKAAQPAPLAVRCTAPAPSTCLNVQPDHQISPDTSYTGYAGETAVSPEALERLKARARALNSYYPSGCPTSPAGELVYVESGDCGYAGGGAANAESTPGMFIVEHGTVDFGGSMEFYGLVYAANAQRSAGAVVSVRGSALIQGSVAVDAGGGVTIGSSGRNLVYDARVFPMIKSFGAAAPVQGTWRELPAS
jgi:type II secretory pathway pseudopilin PulG